MKIRLYLACTREVRPVLEMTPLTECQPKFSCCYTDQNQAKIQNLYIFSFSGDITISMYPLPLCNFLSLILGTLLPTSLVTSFLNVPLVDNVFNTFMIAANQVISGFFEWLHFLPRISDLWCVDIMVKYMFNKYSVTFKTQFGGIGNIL